MDHHLARYWFRHPANSNALLLLTAAIFSFLDGSRAAGQEDEFPSVWEYEVSLISEESQQAVASGTLSVVYASRSTDLLTAFWHFDQDATLNLDFRRRMGQWDFSPASGAVDGEPPQMRLSHAQRMHTVVIPIPLLSRPETLREGTQWETADAEFEVKDLRRGAGGTALIEVRDSIGRSSSLLTEVAGDRVLEVQQRVFVGQGDAFQLRMRRTSASAVEFGEPAAIEGATLQLAELFGATNLSKPETLLELRNIASDSDSLWVEQLVADAVRELDSEMRLGRSVEQLRQRAVGSMLAEFEMTDLEGNRWESRKLFPANNESADAARTTDEEASSSEGRVTLFHVWKYREENLEPPYGQIGFLDFAARRHRDRLQVFGVTEVDGDNESLVAAQTRSGRHLRDFMNLSYTILIDDGVWLTELGDPRLVRQPLPLWVVVAPDGRVSTYHAGLLDEEPTRAISQLEEWITKALRDSAER